MLFFGRFFFDKRPLSKHNEKLPKPEKMKCKSAVICGRQPMTDHPDQEKWYCYGRESAKIIAFYTDNPDPVLLPLIFERCSTEMQGWLAMNPPDYAGAAKQCLTIEALRFTAGFSHAAVKEAMDKTDDYIDKSGPEWHNELVEVRDYNRLAHSMLPQCAYCAKHLQKRNFCKKCMIAVYCGQQCQQKHWDEGHRQLCGKQKHCKACNKLLEKPMQCTRCKAAWYCNTAHQKHDWEKCHKQECKKAHVE